jgi:DNA-binding NarL/FixJ family response regulator
MAKFLIIDRNILTNTALLASMKLAGHEAEAVTEFGANEPIITRTRTLQPDLIIIDPTSAGSHDGFSLVSDLKAHPETKGVLIVAYSDSPDLRLRERLLNLGASTHYDRSSLAAEELINRLEKIIINKEKYDS